MESHLPINGPNDALIGLMAQSGFAGAMVDTARKNRGRLLDHMDIAAIGSLSICARTHGQIAGLARCKGSLSPASPNYHFAEGQAQA